MGFLERLFGRRKAERLAVLRALQQRFGIFRALLDRQNQVLRSLGELEQLGSTSGRVDLYTTLAEIEAGTEDIIEKMIALGGDEYRVLRQRMAVIREQLGAALSPDQPVAEAPFVIPFEALGREHAAQVGAKSANLGELRSRLGLPVPDGFAISAWAYRTFVERNDLRKRIAALLADLQAKSHSELDVISDELRALIIRSPVPAELSAAIQGAIRDLARRTGSERFALRSSAIGEDQAFTFAGQYLTFLNIRPDNILDYYREILASKFTPQVIYYLMHHRLRSSDLSMAVVCMELVDARSSGVVYTRDPLDPDSPHLVVNALYGLGSYLVEGTLTPDLFHLSREDGSVLAERISQKSVCLQRLPEGGTIEVAILEAEQSQPSLDRAGLRRLSELALEVERHCGGPQDIEWAADRDGRLFLLQSRPLALLRFKATEPAPAELASQVLLRGGTPVFPGAGAGPVFQLESPADLPRVPAGAVLVSRNPFPGLIAVMRRIAGLVTEVGGTASHMATLAREMWLPTVVAMAGANEIPPGTGVTLDATEGVLYRGEHPGLVALRDPGQALLQAPSQPPVVGRVLEATSHLNLISPADPDFRAERCQSIHDITRFIHQRSMEEMFSAMKRTLHKDRIGLRLKTNIPLIVYVIHLDRDPFELSSRRAIALEEIDSIPMVALWGGVQAEGWPSRPVPPDLRGFLAVVGANIQDGHSQEFSEDSYAFLSREYMLLNLRMGYHYATIEALLTDEPSQNYIRMQFKNGGAPLDRRVRRIRLIADLLRKLGFEDRGRGDFLDASVAYQSPEAMAVSLRLLGRINIITKQLDMALANDAVTEWYYQDFLKKLGLL